MRILHVVHQFPPEHIGGTEFHTQWLAKAQKGQGHDVAVFHRRSGDGEGMKAHEMDSVSIYSAWSGPMTPNNRFRATFGEQALSTQFSQALIEFKPDLVHFQHIMGLPHSLGAQVQRLGIPYLVTIYDYFYFCANAQLLTNYDDSLCNGPRAFVNCARCAISRAGRPHAFVAVPPLVPVLGWRNHRLKRFLQGAKQFIVPTQFVRDVYARRGLPDEKMHVIPYGIELPDPEDVAQLGEKRPFSPPLQVAYIGGISPQKGIDVLVTAVAKLPPSQINCTIYGDLTGFPDYVNKMLEDLPANITFAGRLPRPVLWQTLHQTDIVVVPALWHETSSIIIDEAHVMNVPVIASKLGGMSEKIRHGENGFHLTPGDVDELTSHLQTLINSPALLAEFSLNTPVVPTQQQILDLISAVYQKI